MISMSCFFAHGRTSRRVASPEETTKQTKKREEEIRQLPLDDKGVGSIIAIGNGRDSC